MTSPLTDPDGRPVPRITVEVWADVVCPWCYMGKRRLEQAIHAFEHPAQVEVRYRSFELDPTAPVGGGVPVVEHLGSWYGAGEARARDAVAHVAQIALGDELVLDFGTALRANSFDAHRLVQQGLDQGGLALQGAVMERLFAAHFIEGKALDDRATLQRLGPEAGLDERRVAAVLSSHDYAAEVRADEAAAAELGVTSVPFVLANRRVAFTGAQPVDTFLELLHAAWRDLSPSPERSAPSVR